MDNLSKLLIFLILIIITYSFLNKKENFKAIFTSDLNLEIDKNIEFKGKNLILKSKNIKAEEICLGKKGSPNPVCINQTELQRIISYPNKFKNSICVGNNCSRAEQFYYLKKLWPIGSVIPFQGRESDLPSGWRVCDGKNHLPDLRDSFIKGAGTTDEKYIGFRESGNILDGFGVNGGENEVTLDIKHTPRHYHFFNINDIRKNGNVSGVRSHYASKDSSAFAVYNNDYKLPQPAWGRKNNLDILTPYTTTPTSLYGKGNPHNNLPPYYTLMYIIRVSEDNIENTEPKTDESSGSNYFIYNILEKQLSSFKNKRPLSNIKNEIRVAPPVRDKATANMFGPWIDNSPLVQGVKHKSKDFFIFFTYDDVYYKMVKRTQDQIENNSNPSYSENKAYKTSKKSNITASMISDMWDLPHSTFTVPSGNYRLKNMTFL